MNQTSSIPPQSLRAFDPASLYLLEYSGMPNSLAYHSHVVQFDRAHHIQKNFIFRPVEVIFLIFIECQKLSMVLVFQKN